MSISEHQDVEQSIAVPDADLSSTDLAELMSAFTDVTTKLEKTHGQLRSEVSRLSTELHQANEALQRSRRLAALGEMAAGISHEIRNPLGSIRLYANMLIEDLSEAPEQKQIVEKIGRAVRGLDEIVGDVLTFAREMKVNWHQCDSSALIDSSLELCCAEAGPSVIRRYLDHDSMALECDSTLIQQAFVNVIRNACEANRVSGGERVLIEVEDCNVRLGDQQTPCIRFTVSDQGDGVPNEVIERMFNPFFTTRATGTGLGLAIVHRIVDVHRGKIEVENNQRSSGASVHLYIPKSQSLVVARSHSDSGTGEIFVQRQQAAVVSLG
ncbi:MAG: ATP-binding protein [Phycisphaerales bacterium]|nr:ATP-binding protein [Phycisphaerales bacterium]